MRLIATEEAFAPIEYIDEFLKLTKTVDTAPSRYLGIYYSKPEFVRQLTDLDFRLAEMDQHGVDMHLLSITGPGVQAFDASLGSELAILANDTLARAIAKRPDRYAGLGAVAPQDPQRAGPAERHNTHHPVLAAAMELMESHIADPLGAAHAAAPDRPLRPLLPDRCRSGRPGHGSRTPRRGHRLRLVRAA